MSSIYSWTPVSPGSGAGYAGNWTLVSGPGNALGYPHFPGDGAIVSAGASVLPIEDGVLIGNSIDLADGSASLSQTALLGPVTSFSFSGTPVQGAVISFSIESPTLGLADQFSYTVTSADVVSAATALTNVLSNIDAILEQDAAALGLYVVETGSGFAIGSYAGATVAVSVAVSSGGGFGVSTPTAYSGSLVTDSGTVSGGTALLDAGGVVYNGGTIAAAASGATLEIAIGSAGDLVNFGAIEVAGGAGLVISTAGSAGYLDNDGAITVASGGSALIAARENNDDGFITVTSGATLELADAVPSRQHLVFDTANAGGVLRIDSGALTSGVLDAKIEGFSAGDVIYLPGVTSAAGQIAAAWSSGTLTVTSGGVTVFEAERQTGIYNSGDFFFATGAGGSGLEILTGVSDARWIGAGGSGWNTAANWSTNAVPNGSAAAIVVDSGAQSDVLATGSGGSLGAGSIELDDTADTGFTLAVQDDLTIKRSLINLVNSVTLTDGAVLSAQTYQQFGSVTGLSVTSRTLDLTGSTGNGDLDGLTGAVIDGVAGIVGSAAALSAGGAIDIGIGSPTGTLFVTSGAQVTATYTALGATGGGGGGTLYIAGSGTSWTDNGSDSSEPYLYDTVRAAMEVGIGTAATSNGGGSGTLTVAGSATLVDSGAALIGGNGSGSFGGTGTVNIEGGASWSLVYSGGADLIVGGSAAVGTLNVRSGGTVSIASGGDIRAGAVGGGTGTINLSGSGSLISTSGELELGRHGALNMDAGAVVSAGSVVLDGGVAFAGISGAGTLLVDSGSFVASGGVVAVANGAAISAASIALTSTTTVVEGGSLIDAGSLSMAPSELMEVESGGSVTVSGAITEGLIVLGHSAVFEALGANGIAALTSAATVFFTGQDTLALGSPGSFYGTIGDFTSSDRIDLLNMAPGDLSFSYSATAGVLEVSSGGAVVADLEIGSTYSGASFSAVTDAHNGAFIETSVPCYCRGTRILTDSGEVAVEDLAIGDRLVTRSGEARPLRWIGRRSYEGRFAARNPDVMPILVKAGALADGIPARDLHVSPLHALFIEGRLVPAKFLVNRASILQRDAAERVDYFHLELETHDVIIAEGAAAESYADDGNRGMFQNAGDCGIAAQTEARYCAERVESGAWLDGLRTRLAARARQIGYRGPGAVMANLAEGENAIILPAGCDELRLLSPVHAASRDERALGRLLSRIALDGEVLAIEDARLKRGFHPAELHQGAQVRWISGEAVISCGISDHDRQVVITAVALNRRKVA